MPLIFVSKLDWDYSRSGVYFAKCEEPKLFIKLPKQKIKLVKKIREMKVRHSSTNTKIVVMSPQHSLVIFFYIFTDFRVVLDAGWPLSDATFEKSKFSGRRRNFYSYVIDYISFKLASRIVLESQAQVVHVSLKFCVPREKLRSLLTGMNEILFSESKNHIVRPIELNAQTTDSKVLPIVFFRGKNNLEAGLDVIIKAAEFLIGQTTFVIVTNRCSGRIPSNVVVIRRFIPIGELIWLYKNSIIVLGQISTNRRLSRTLPHKVFEAAYFNKCYLTPPSLALNELLDSNSFIPLVDITAQGLAKTIQSTLNNPTKIKSLETNIGMNYRDRASQAYLSEQFIHVVS